MKLNFEINRQDYADFNRYNFVKTRLKRTILTGVIALGVTQIILNQDKFDLFLTLVSSVAFILVFYFMISSSLSSTGKIPKTGGTILGAREMEFKDSEIICKATDVNSTVGWTKVRELANGKSALYLYIDTNQAFLIPKRVFGSENELKEFIQFIDSKIQSVKH